MVLSAVKIFYFNATEIAALVGMSPFSSGRTSLLKAWKKTSETSFKKSKKMFESGDLEEAAAAAVATTTTTPSKQKNKKEERCLNGIEREPIILDAVDKRYASSYFCRNNDIKKKNWLANPIKKILSYSSLFLSVFGLNILNAHWTTTSGGGDFSLNATADFSLPSSDFLILNGILFSYLAGAALFFSPFGGGRDTSTSTVTAAKEEEKETPPPFVERNCEIKYMYITPAKKSYEIKIGGRCDGLIKSTGEIIECKARQYKLFHKVYDTERIQATLYLAIMNDIETQRFSKGGVEPIVMDYSVCKLFEEYKGEIDVHTIPFDLHFYEMIRERLIKTVDLLYKASVLQEPKAQLEIWKMSSTTTSRDDDDDESE